jgi:hypothetical protein
MDAATEEYLAKVRKTIAESKQMLEMVKLRFAETDRMLEASGTSREEVMQMRFSEEQRAAVNAELERRGMAPLAEVEESRVAPRVMPMAEAADAETDGETRRRKFATMMKTFRI